MYKVKMLPSARHDLRVLINYISNVLKNPIAARNLKNLFKEKVDMLKEFPLSYAEYQFGSEEEFEKTYRMMSVKNHSVFYVLNDNTVEIHRIIYGRMNFNKQFENQME